MLLGFASGLQQFYDISSLQILLIGLLWGGATGSIAVVCTEIYRRYQADKQANHCVNELADLYNNVLCGHHSLDGDGVFVRINDTALNWLDYTREDLIGQKKFTDLLTPVEQEVFKQNFEQFKQRGWVKNLEFQLICADGSLLPVLLTATAVKDEAGNFIMSRSTIFDISDRKQAEAQMQLSLQEKEVLLKEVHHRVKNNLHIISSLLDLQSEQVETEHLLELFTDSQNRIQAMALIHEQLYQSQASGRVEFGEYIHRLLSNLSFSYGNQMRSIQTTIETEPIHISLETAFPCGLLLNELITNAFKHAFPDGQPGLIQIHLYRDQTEQIHLCIHDNGIGIPATVDWQNSVTLGLRLVRILAKQLKSTISVDTSQGTSVCLTFSELKYKRRS